MIHVRHVLAAHYYLSQPTQHSYYKAAYPRPICPACSSDYTFVLFAGLYDEFPWDISPSWAIPIGCVYTGHDCLCRDCEYIWAMDGKTEPVYAYDVGSGLNWLSRRPAAESVEQNDAESE